MDKHKKLLNACDGSVTLDEIVSMVYREKDDCPIVYFLVDGDEIVYIGQSKRPVARFKQHLKEGKKEFTHIYFKQVPDIVRLVYVESLCLHYLGSMTKYNRHYNYVDSKGKNPITDSKLQAIANKTIKSIQRNNKLWLEKVRQDEIRINQYKQTEEYRRDLILRAVSIDR